MTTNRRDVLALAGITMAALGGCTMTDTDDTDSEPSPGSAGGDEPIESQLLSADVDRADPAVSDDALEALVDGVNAFSLALLDELADGEETNHFASPYSVSLALAMAWAGARGETETAMADALAFPHEQEQLHETFNALSQSLEEVPDDGDDEDEDATEFTLRIANAIWGHADYPFGDAFLETLARNYGAGLRTLDFEGAPEPSRAEINDWVAEETEDKIEEVLPEGSIHGDTKLVLTNAIYFLANWANQFDEDETEDGTFTALDGSESTVPMMHQHLRTHYAAVDGHQVLELPYEGDATMVVFLPAEGEFEAFRDALDVDRLDELLEATADASGDLALPRFEFESSFSVRDALAALGMEVAFTNQADFTGMLESDASAPSLMIEDVYHDAYVAVDEEGTEAAAATGVTMVPTSAPAETFDVTVDRPFLFAIRDEATGCLLFLGQVVDAGEAQ